MSPLFQPSASHLRQVAYNSDAERIASEQRERERERLSAEKDRLAAQRREEQQAKEKQRIQVKQVQK